jgi:hypothetical protein
LSESKSAIKEIEKSDISLVLSEKPKNRGISNINLQIVSTFNGINYAKINGAKFILKTRTDQRLYATNIYEYFRNLQSIFPPYSNLMNNRIIGISLNTFLYRMYGLSDILMFGQVDDILKFWSVNLDERDPDVTNHTSKKRETLREYAEWNVAEVYLTTEFLKSIGHIPKWTLDDSLETYRKYFCVIDKESIDLFWNKYSISEYRWLRYQLPFSAFREITFRDWLRIYINNKSYKVDESLLDNKNSH